MTKRMIGCPNFVIRHSGFVICTLLLNNFLDKLDEMRAFLPIR